MTARVTLCHTYPELCTPTPSAANDAFPLLSAISTACTLRAQLTGITSRAASVQETKQALLACLGEVVTKLEAAKGSWGVVAKDLPLREEYPSDATFRTGESRFAIQTK